MSTIIRIGIIGYGYVGRATAEAFRDVATVAWCDPNHAGSSSIQELCSTSDFLFVCVPTPQCSDGSPDMAQVNQVLAAISQQTLSPPTLIKSTVPPQTTARLARLYPDINLAFIPEFLREKHYLEDARSPERIVIGWTSTYTDNDRQKLRTLYQAAFKETPILDTTATTAELLKHTSNAFFATKVTFANQMSALASTLSVDWEDVRSMLVLDTRIGSDHLAVPGHDGLAGFGGRCLPKDTAALLFVADQLGVSLSVLRSAVQSNQRIRQQNVPELRSADL